MSFRIKIFKGYFAVLAAPSLFVPAIWTGPIINHVHLKLFSLIIGFLLSSISCQIVFIYIGQWYFGVHRLSFESIAPGASFRGIYDRNSIVHLKIIVVLSLVGLVILSIIGCILLIGLSLINFLQN
jgi:pheromone shutdown protein TraB